MSLNENNFPFISKTQPRRYSLDLAGNWNHSTLEILSFIILLSTIALCLAVLELCSSYISFLTLQRPHIFWGQLSPAHLLSPFSTYHGWSSKLLINCLDSLGLGFHHACAVRTPGHHHELRSLLLSSGGKVFWRKSQSGAHTMPTANRDHSVPAGISAVPFHLILVLGPLFISSSSWVIPNFRTLFSIPSHSLNSLRKLALLWISLNSCL